MPDEIDLANEQAERWLNQALANRSQQPKLAVKGSCHYCEADFAAGDERLFCDSECAQDYEKEQRLRARR